MNHIGSFFSELEDYIANSRKHIAAGEDIDMVGLDQNIETLCNMILEISAEEQMQYQERMQAMLAELNLLGLELKEKLEAATIPDQRRAHVAYKVADSRDNFGKRDEEK